MELDFILPDSKIRLSQIRNKIVEITLLQNLIGKISFQVTACLDHQQLQKGLKQTCEMKEAKRHIIVLQMNI